MRWLKLLWLLIVLGAPLASAQNLSVTATITDSDGQTWNNGTWSAILQSPNGKLFYNGVLIPAQSVSGTLSSSGVLSASLYNTNTITPGGATYVFTICALTPAPCSIITTPVTQSDLSALLSTQVKAPRFAATPTSYGYLDAEINPIPQCGGQYFNTAAQITRQWNCTAGIWQNVGGNVSIGPAGTIQVSNGSGGLQAATTLNVSTLLRTLPDCNVNETQAFVPFLNDCFPFITTAGSSTNQSTNSSLSVNNNYSIINPPTIGNACDNPLSGLMFSINTGGQFIYCNGGIGLTGVWAAIP